MIINEFSGNQILGKTEYLVIVIGNNNNVILLSLDKPSIYIFYVHIQHYGTSLTHFLEIIELLK